VRIPDRFRDRAAIVEASLFGVAAVVVALLGPLWYWLPVVAGPVSAVLVLVVIATLPPPNRDHADTPPSPPPPEPDLVEAALDAGRRVRGWGEQLPQDDGPARDAVELAGSVVRLIVDCDREIGRIGDGAATRPAEDELRTLTKHFTVYVNAGGAPQGPDEWNDLKMNLTSIRLDLRELRERLRGS
jgi:hypothetical protein